MKEIEEEKKGNQKIKQEVKIEDKRIHDGSI